VVSRLEEGAAVGSAWTTWYKMELRDFALFLTHVAPFYPYDLADMVDQIGVCLTQARAVPSGLVHLVQELILLFDFILWPPPNTFI
jgi:hypothetical protein